MTVVATHAHICSEDEATYPEVAQPLRPPKGTGIEEHLRHEIAANGVHRVVLVQTLTAYRYDDRLLCAVAKVNRSWATGVCTFDPTAPQTPDALERLVRESNLQGVRLYPTPAPQPTLRHNEPYPCADTHNAIRAILDAYTPQRCGVFESQNASTSFDETIQRAVLEETPMRLWFPPEGDVS